MANIGDTLPYSVNAQIRTDYNRCLMFTVNGDFPFSVSADSESIANMMVRMGIDAYIYNDITIGATSRNYLSVTVPVLETWKKAYSGKRGRKPNITLYVINSDGIIVDKVTP